MGVRMSWLMAVMSSLLASQARFSLPMRSMIASRMPSISAARPAISSRPSTVMSALRSPAPTAAVSCERRMMRRVSRLVYQKSTATSTTVAITPAMPRFSMSSRARELSVMAM